MTAGQRLARGAQGASSREPYGLNGPAPQPKRLALICLIASLSAPACVSSVDGPPQDQLPAPVAAVQTSRAELCAGRTDLGAWLPDKDGVVHVDIDTSHCGLTGDPLYFTSLGGESRHWSSRGVTSIYRSGPQGFRVVVLSSGAPELSDRGNWYVNWMARTRDVQSPGLCTGRTSPVAFQQYEDGGVSVTVDLRHCDFHEAPVVLTSLGGIEGHAATRGATSVYRVTRDRFTVVIQKPGITVAQAAAWGWHINWSASPPNNDNGDYCTGKSALTDTAWEQYGKNGIIANLETAGCDAPLVFTTLSGDRSHWYTTGSSSIYDANSNGFRLQVSRDRVTPAFAKHNGWHVHWTRVAPTAGRAVVVE